MTGIEVNGSMHDGGGTIGHGLTMDIAKSLTIREHLCYACIAHLNWKVSEQEEGGKSSLIDRVCDAGKNMTNKKGFHTQSD